jgi:hypothetical protein
MAEVIETLRCTKSEKKLAHLLNGNRKWFIHLDQMSSKDSSCGGQLPSSTFEEVLTKICTSTRAYGCLRREFADAETEGKEMEIKLVLDPWDEGMDPGREVRVFIPPPAASGKVVTPENLVVGAVSQ